MVSTPSFESHRRAWWTVRSTRNQNSTYNRTSTYNRSRYVIKTLLPVWQYHHLTLEMMPPHCGYVQHSVGISWGWQWTYSFKEGLKGQYMHLYCVFKMNDPICRAGVRSEQSLVIDRCYHVMTKTSPNLFKIGTKGQLISEWLFGVFNFPKNQHKNLTNFCPRI